jgi:hypothetical protein
MTNQELLECGYALCRIPTGQKGPTYSGWNTLEGCITDPARCHELHGYNVGLVRAYCKPGPTCAIDIDNYRDSKAWLSRQGISLNKLLLKSDAVIVHSGKRHSIKPLYRLPDGVGPLESQKSTVRLVAVRLSFVVAPKTGKACKMCCHRAGTQPGANTSGLAMATLETYRHYPVKCCCYGSSYWLRTPKPATVIVQSSLQVTTGQSHPERLPI